MTDKEKKAYKREYYQKNKEKENARVNAWRKAHPERVKEYSNKYDHSEAGQKKRAEWRAAHHEEQLVYWREYNKKRYAKKKSEKELTSKFDKKQ